MHVCVVWTPEKDEQLVELTVALPIPELVRARTEAYEIMFQKMEAMNARQKQDEDHAHMKAIARKLNEELEKDLGIDLDGDGEVGGVRGCSRSRGLSRRILSSLRIFWLAGLIGRSAVALRAKFNADLG